VSATAVDLHAWLEMQRRTVDAALERWVPSAPLAPAAVCDAMRYSLFAGGKRLRPMLVLAAAEAVAARNGRSLDDARERALPAACAIELIHTYSLVHDDLPAMDNDTMRRGRPTAHVVFGEGMAILSGDALLTEAFALLAPRTAARPTTRGRAGGCARSARSRRRPARRGWSAARPSTCSPPCPVRPRWTRRRFATCTHARRAR
jgi:geranylgeranyl diphosphate synthase type II